MTSIDARLRALERASIEGAQAVVLLFGDDPIPEGVTEHMVVLRFDERLRDL